MSASGYTRFGSLVSANHQPARSVSENIQGYVVLRGVYFGITLCSLVSYRIYRRGPISYREAQSWCAELQLLLFIPHRKRQVPPHASAKHEKTRLEKTTVSWTHQHHHNRCDHLTVAIRFCIIHDDRRPFPPHVRRHISRQVNGI